jgi:hypothetical protein
MQCRFDQCVFLEAETCSQNRNERIMHKWQLVQLHWGSFMVKTKPLGLCD